MLSVGIRQRFSTLTMWRIIAILLLGAMLARWTWVFFAPRSEVVIPTTRAPSAAATANLFGIPAISSVAVAVLPNVRLVGVFAAKPGFALFELDGKRQIAAALGEKLAGNGKLVEVAMNYAVIERNGARQKIFLEGQASAIKSASAANAQAIP